MATKHENKVGAEDRWLVGTPYGKDHRSRAIEFFEVIRRSANHLSIKATRTIDLLSLEFELWGFDYDENRNWIRVGGTSGRIAVSFPPQHIAETVHQKYDQDPEDPAVQDDVAVCENASDWDHSKLRPARKSRLEFEIDDPLKFAGQLSLETLLNWSELRMKVDPRAGSGIGFDALSQLRALFPGKTDQEIAAVNTRELKQQLFNAATDIAKGSTELELVRDLTFSPSEKTTWMPSRQPSREIHVVRDERAELWGVQIEGAGRTSLRAIHSRWLANVLGDLGDLPTEEDLQIARDPLLALTIANHWDIVGQTSLYGLPALSKIEGGTEEQDGLVSGKAASDALDAPPPTVVPPPAELGELSYVEHHKSFYENLAGHRDVGLSLASPFSNARVDLTSLGAIMDLEWRGDPSSVLLRNLDENGDAVDQKQYASFGLETLLYRSWLGRDARIEAVEKGYLLPLGIRASLLTITERKIYGRHESLTEELQPTSLEVQRQIIVVPGRDKRFPGPYQFDDGRRFPAKRLNIKTRATPDLFRNANIIPGLAERTAFWPQVAVNEHAGNNTFVGQDFDFEWQTEDALAKSNLLFVSHRHIANRDTMRRIKEAYNTSEERLRQARFGGARQRYAKPGNPGDTSFDTNYWLMEAEGRIGTRETQDAKPTEVFDLDGRLAGADQPPLYPKIKYADINVQTVDQTLGEAQGGIKVRPYSRYVRDGFVPESKARRRNDELQPENNPREIFLEVIDGEIAIESANRSGRTGGVASPRANVAAFSRKDGVIGGEKVGSRANEGPAFDFSKAEEGEFAPSQFFDGAKLLGIINLGDLGELAIDKGAFPQLQQVVEYGAGKGQEYIRRAASELLRLIYIDRGGLAKQLRNAIDATNARLKATEELKNYSFDDIVSEDLKKAIGAIIAGNPPPLRAKLAALDANPGIAEIKAVSKLASDIAEWVGDFLEDPVPPLIKDGLQRVADFVRWIEDASDPSNLKTRLAEYLRTTLINVLKDGWDSEFARVLFGEFAFDANGNRRGLDQVLGQPGLAMEALRANILSGAFGGLLDFAWPYLVAAADFADQANRYLDELQARAEATLRDALIAIGEELDDFNPTIIDDLRQPGEQEKLIDDLKNHLNAHISKFLKGLSSNAVEARLDFEDISERIDRFEAESRDSIETELSRRLDKIKVPNQVDKERLSRAIAKALHENLVMRHLVPTLRDLNSKVRNAGANKARHLLLAVEQFSQSFIETWLIGAIFAESSKLADLIDQVRLAALALVEKGLADVARFRVLAGKLREQGEELQGKSSWHAQQLGNEIVAVSDRIDHAIARFDSALRKAKQSAGAGLDLIDPVAEALKLRSRMLDELRNLLAISFDGVPETAVATKQTLFETLKDLVKALSPAFETGWDWQEINDVIATLKSQTGIIKQHAEDVEARLDEVVKAYADLETKFATVSTYSDLRDFLENEVATLLGHVDDHLAGKVLQLTAFPQQVGQKLKTGMASAAMDLWKKANQGDPLELFYIFKGEAQKAQNLIASLDEPQNQDLRDAIDFILGGSTPRLGLKAALGQLAELATKIAGLGNVSDFDDFKVRLESILGPNGSAVEQLFEQFESAYDAIEVVNAGQVLTQAVSSLLDTLEAELRALVGRFVPTRLTTTYHWESNIGQFPKDNRNAVYIPCRLSANCEDPRPPGLPEEEEWPPKDLKLSATFIFDFASREKLAAEVRGELHKFQLKILGEEWNMATVTFTKCTFVSINGAKPDFDIKIGDVVLGPMLRFLEPLQKWLSPDGTGFYLTLNQSPPGVKAGYIYNAGIIQLGTLQFINVNFGVDATLPFNGDEAEFGFALGSAKLPFMVANPPYGGGGWVRLTANAQGPTGMELSIFFGGVSAIRFGPLKGQGRIVAGLFVKTNSNKSSLLKAYFEAVGSGSIACFSISVSLVVQLTQRNGGKMYGTATFTFKFKLGFVKYKYRVEASYTISNGKGPRTLHAVERAALAGPAPLITVHMPRKAERWSDYRQLVDTSLV